MASENAGEFRAWLAKAVDGDFGELNDKPSDFSNHWMWHHHHRYYWWPWFWYTTGDTGNTPLHDALAAGNDTVAAELIENNADVNAKNKAGVTPLHLAVNDKCKQMVKYLIQKGADPKATDNDGKNPEAYALEGTVKDETVKSEATKVEPTRRRRQAPIGGPTMWLTGSSHQAGNQAQIAGPANGVARAYMPDSAAVNDATMLIELAMRKLTGAKHAPAVQFPETKDQYMTRKVDAVEGRLSSALKKFSGASSE